MTAKAFLLTDKVALVAGDSKIWSKAVAEALAGAEADIAIAAKNSPSLEDAAEALARICKERMLLSDGDARLGHADDLSFIIYRPTGGAR